jgi:hypothetical protein
MTTESDNNGLSFLEKLDRYWASRSTPKPKFVTNEKLICISPEHWIKYVLPFMLYILLTGAALFFFFLATLNTENLLSFFTFFLVGCAVLICVHHWFYWFLLAESQACIIVTNKRVIHIRQGLLWHEQIMDIAFEKMKTVEAHKKTLLQSFLNYGTLQFEPTVKIHRTPRPGTLVREIEQAMGLI